MKNNIWKTMAIISIILNVLFLIFWFWAYMDLIKEEETTYECYYEICDGSHDAWYEDNICTCYDLDVIGEYVVSKEKYMR